MPPVSIRIAIQVLETRHYLLLSVLQFCARGCEERHQWLCRATQPEIQRERASFGATIRYLPSAEREVEKREKLEASLRDAIFVGYRMHTGGRWTGQCQLIDAEAFTEVACKTGRMAYVHAVSEIHVPGSASDDKESFPTFPVAEGKWTELKAQTEDGTDLPSSSCKAEARNLEVLHT